MRVFRAVCRLLVSREFEVMYMCSYFFFLMIRRPPRSTQSRSSAASDVYKRQGIEYGLIIALLTLVIVAGIGRAGDAVETMFANQDLSLIHISEPTRPY